LYIGSLILVYTSLVSNSFCLILGMEMEGIYRLSGQHSKVTQLLKLLLEGIIFTLQFIDCVVSAVSMCLSAADKA